MSGIYGADRGEVRFEGQPAPALGDVEAWRQRISTVFQHSMVVPKLTVAENVFLNTQPARSGFLDWKTMRAEAKQVLAEWGFGNVDANALCSTLTVEQRQLVEIARALAAGRRCLLLDEPTSALERAEIQRLFERVRSMVANGVAVLYISHHLEEVFEVCDDVAVLRDGELVMSRPTAGLSKDELVAAMVGPDAAAIARVEHPGATGKRPNGRPWQAVPGGQAPLGTFPAGRCARRVARGTARGAGRPSPAVRCWSGHSRPGSSGLRELGLRQHRSRGRPNCAHAA